MADRRGQWARDGRRARDRRGIARELAEAGARVAVSARTASQVEEVARETGGLAIEADVSDRAAVEAMVAQVERELGPIERSSTTPGISLGAARVGGRPRRLVARLRGQRARRVPVLARRAPRHARARRGPHRQHRQRRRVPARVELDGLLREQGGALPLRRDARRAAGRPPASPSSSISPGLVRTEMTEDASPTTRRGRRPSWRRSSCACCSRPRRRARRAATSTRSTTTSRT